MYLLNILDNTTDKFYNNHSTFHNNDSGIDLFFADNIIIKAGETKLISLKINMRHHYYYQEGLFIKHL